MKRYYASSRERRAWGRAIPALVIPSMRRAGDVAIRRELLTWRAARDLRGPLQRGHGFGAEQLRSGVRFAESVTRSQRTPQILRFAPRNMPQAMSEVLGAALAQDDGLSAVHLP